MLSRIKNKINECRRKKDDIESNKQKYKKEKNIITKKGDIINKQSKPIKNSIEIKTFIENSNNIEITFDKKSQQNFQKKLEEISDLDLNLVLNIQNIEKDLHPGLRFVNKKKDVCLISNLKTKGKVLKEIKIKSKCDIVIYEHKKDNEWTGLIKQKYPINDNEKLVIQIEDIDSTKSGILTRTAKAAGGFTKEEIKKNFIANEEYFDDYFDSY